MHHIQRCECTELFRPFMAIPSGTQQSRAIQNVVSVQSRSLTLHALPIPVALHGEPAAYKSEAFGDIAIFIALSTERYGTRVGGEKGNVTLLSSDGRFKIVRAVRENSALDEPGQVPGSRSCIRVYERVGSSDQYQPISVDIAGV